MKGEIEIWRVIDDEGAYYTLENSKKDIQAFMKLGVPGPKLNIGEKVAVNFADGLKTIMSKVPEHIDFSDIQRLICQF